VQRFHIGGNFYRRFRKQALLKHRAAFLSPMSHVLAVAAVKSYNSVEWQYAVFHFAMRQLSADGGVN
jgi:hypothetical protein